MKKRKILPVLALILALSTGVMFTACTPNIGGPSAEEIAAQKEAEEKKAALAPFVGVWEAKSISDPKKGEIPESVYPTARDTFQAIYGYDFSDDGTGLFIRFGAQKPFTWTADADGKITITLAGNAGSYTATVDSSGQMTIEGSDGSKAVLTQVTKTSGDYSSLKYAPFDALTGKGTIGGNYSSHDDFYMNFKVVTEVNRVVVDNDDMYVRYVGIATTSSGLSEGYVFEVINKSDKTASYDFRLDNSDSTVFGTTLNVLEPGERFYEFVVDSSKAEVPLAKLSESKGTFTYSHVADGSSLEDEKTEQFDLTISQNK